MGAKQKIPTWKKKMYRILCDRQQKREKNRGKPPDVRCRNPGSNQGPLDLQSNALPTELFRLPITKAEITSRRDGEREREREREREKEREIIWESDRE